MTYIVPTKINSDNARWLGARIFGKFYYQISPEIASALPALLKTIDPRESRVVIMRYGLDGTRAMTLQEVGDILHLSHERIRQIEKRAILRLRHSTRSKQLRKYVIEYLRDGGKG